MNSGDPGPLASVLAALEEVRPVLHPAGIRVELVTRPHRHGFTVFEIHANERVREVSDPGEAIEYLYGLRDGVQLNGQDALSQLERAVREARKRKT